MGLNIQKLHQSCSKVKKRYLLLPSKQLLIISTQDFLRILRHVSSLCGSDAWCSDEPLQGLHCYSIPLHISHRWHSKRFRVHASGPEQNPLCTDCSGNTAVCPLGSGSRCVCPVHADREQRSCDSQQKLKLWNLTHFFCIDSWICLHGRISNLNSILPHANILLSQIQPPHHALSMPQVVVPLTRVKVARGVAVRTQVSPLGQY